MRVRCVIPEHRFDLFSPSERDQVYSVQAAGPRPRRPPRYYVMNCAETSPKKHRGAWTHTVTLNERRCTLIPLSLVH